VEKVIRKLVRDRIPEIMEQSGRKANVVHATHEEYGALLKEKLVEEVKEFLESETAEELGDILEVIDALCVWKKISPEDLKEIKELKFQVRGGFAKRYVATFSLPQ